MSDITQVIDGRSADAFPSLHQLHRHSCHDFRDDFRDLASRCPRVCLLLNRQGFNLRGCLVPLAHRSELVTFLHVHYRESEEPRPFRRYLRGRNGIERKVLKRHD